MYREITLEEELQDAWTGEGNSKRITFKRWVKAMAANPKGTLNEAAIRFLAGQCGWCGNDLSIEEVQYPAKDWDGSTIDDNICDECFHEHYEFTCDRCCNYDYDHFQHGFLVVYEETPGLHKPVPRGIYRITGTPYFGGPMIGGGYLFDDVLKLTKAKIDFNQDNYPCGHLCRSCVKKLGLRVKSRK